MNVVLEIEGVRYQCLPIKKEREIIKEKRNEKLINLQKCMIEYGATKLISKMYKMLIHCYMFGINITNVADELQINKDEAKLILMLLLKYNIVTQIYNKKYRILDNERTALIDGMEQYIRGGHRA